MAAVSFSALPASVVSMSNRRAAPLSNNPNAINSPFKNIPASTSSKSKRSYASVQREEGYAQPPPAKKQMLESHQTLKSSPRHQIKSTFFSIQLRKDNCLQQASINERKTPKTREKSQRVSTKSEWGLTNDYKSIRQWQKHYRRIFPTFVFYFENVSSEVQMNYTKAVVNLGAREEKFFSNIVTHVITTRSIPPEISVNPTDAASTNLNSQLQEHSLQSHNNHLETSLEPANNAEPTTISLTQDLSVASMKNAGNCNIGDTKRYQCRSTDFLQKARELGMKIWSLEKFKRIISVIFDKEAGYQVSHTIGSRLGHDSVSISRPGRETDLQKLLRNERINGPSDRDLTVASRELHTFKGPYIHIYDINEKHRPIMAREYPFVLNKALGDWPQFRSVSNGKCPFIDEVDYARLEEEREIEEIRIQRQLEKEKMCSNPNLAQQRMFQQPKASPGKWISEELCNDLTSTPMMTKLKEPTVQAKKLLPTKIEDKSTLRGNAFVSRAGRGYLQDDEPVASGVQPAITSAIRSTMSSTASQHGVLAGTSKEIHGMQRKVLVKNISGTSCRDPANHQRMIDENVSPRENITARICKRKAPENFVTSDENERSKLKGNTQNDENTRKKRYLYDPIYAHQEVKPGYCENCQDKFHDFNKHINSRKHRKFAEKMENWKSLDELLAQLVRPLRRDVQDPFV